MSRMKKDEVFIFGCILFTVLFMTIGILALGASEQGNFGLALGYIGIDGIVAFVIYVVVKILEDL